MRLEARAGFPRQLPGSQQFAERATTRTGRLLAPVTWAGCPGPKVNTQATVLYKSLIPSIHKTPFIQQHFKALVHPAYNGVKLNSVTSAPSNNEKSSQAFIESLQPSCRSILLQPWPCPHVHGSWPSGIQVIHAPRDNLGTQACSHIRCVYERTQGVWISPGEKLPNIKTTECFGTLSKTPPAKKQQKNLNTECDQQKYFTYLGLHMKVTILLSRTHTSLS